MKRVLNLYKQAFSGLGRDIWFISLIALINRAGTMVFPFMTLYLMKEENFTAGQAGWLLLAFGTGSFSGAYLGGLASGRWGAFTILTASLISSGCVFIAFPFFHGFATLLVGCYLLGLTADAFRPSVLAAVALNSTPENQSRAFALLRLALNTGMGVGPALGGYLAAKNYTLIFAVDGATCLLAGLLVPFIFSSKFSAAHKAKEAEDKKASTGQPLKDAPFMFLMLLIFGFSFVLFQFMGAYPLFLNQQYGLPENTIGLLFAANALVLAIFEMVLVHRLETVNPLHLFGVGSFFACLGFALLPMGTHFNFALFCILVFTFGEMLSLPFSNTLVAMRSGANTGAYMGVYSAVFSVAIMVGPPLGLYLMETWGPEMFWFSQGVLGLLVWIGCFALNRWSDYAAAYKSKSGALL